MGGRHLDHARDPADLVRGHLGFEAINAVPDPAPHERAGFDHHAADVELACHRFKEHAVECTKCTRHE
jgi:hypothetical protein